uniref:Uncharacterized protein LOC114329946 n=3 Tax=Diabrotica virgifera virgifera TaxID=50390 RepID=A0A6P7GRD0_DIAVI
MSDSTSKGKSYKKCIKCGADERKATSYKKFIVSDSLANQINQVLNLNSALGDYICKSCYTTFQFLNPKPKEQQDSSQQEQCSQSTQTDSQGSGPITLSQSSSNVSEFVLEEYPKEEEECIELPFPRPISTHKYCFLCGKSTIIVNVPFNARKQVFTSKKIFIPDGNRCCSTHLIKKRFFEDEINNIQVYTHYSSIKKSDVIKLLENLRVDIDKELTDKIGECSLSEERLLIFTGLTWENIIMLRDMMTSLRNTESRNIIQALVVFLFKLRSGNSNNTIAAVLGLERPQQVSDFSASILSSFEKDVLPSRFGIQAANRQHLIDQTAPVAKILYDIRGDQLGLVCDGTYLRHEKSSNNEYQRKSYSGQKKAPLCKPFTICTTNGYIIDILGPYYATDNDAKILESILNDPNGLITLLQEGDKFFLDRGFRDVIQKLSNLQFQALMPALKGKRKQLTSIEANESRMVTMVRWVVEAVHGVISQKYKLLHNQFDNKMIPNAALYCKIAGFLINTFGKRYVSEVSSKNEIIAQINKIKSLENTLLQECEENRWGRRKTLFQPLQSNDVLDFPEMTEQDLITFFTGTYQLKQSISYLAELITEDNKVDLQFLKETADIIKIQVRSRHIKAKTYNCYIHYQPHSIGTSGIKRHYCDCANGARTIGCCSHVAAIIYYLSNARYLAKIVNPAKILTNIFDSNVIPVINEDSDED